MGPYGTLKDYEAVWDTMGHTKAVSPSMFQLPPGGLYSSRPGLTRMPALTRPLPAPGRSSRRARLLNSLL